MPALYISLAAVAAGIDCRGSQGPATSDLKALRGREELGRKSSLLDLIKEKDDFCA